MSILAQAASGRIYIANQPVVYDDLDDLEAWLIRLYNDLVAARGAAPPARPCPDARCHKLAHPDHSNGHIYYGSTWPDKTERRDARLGDRL